MPNRFLSLLLFTRVLQTIKPAVKKVKHTFLRVEMDTGTALPVVSVQLRISESAVGQ